jgi:excisionase family DNA binding protein
MLTVREVADRLRLSVSQVYALCASGKLPHLRFGNGRGTIRVTEAQLQEFIEACEVTPVASLPEGLTHIRQPGERSRPGASAPR